MQKKTFTLSIIFTVEKTKLLDQKLLISNNKRKHEAI